MDREGKKKWSEHKVGTEVACGTREIVKTQIDQPGRKCGCRIKDGGKRSEGWANHHDGRFRSQATAVEDRNESSILGDGTREHSNREDEVATGLSRQGRTLQQEILEETNGESPQKDVLVNQNVGGALTRRCSRP